MENKVYKMIELAKDDGKWNAISLLEEPYDGIIYCYNWVKAPEFKNDYTLKFDYDIMENPNQIPEDDDFKNLLGDILVDLYMSKPEETEKK